eukprot:Gregarina_sp_Poly_1__4032@NODE_221_length_11248_cov_177_758072_g195_i0_p5_GENE_NODE_221_length_11248_cov_177_758072_g195_i0NODE_221_length_11248_cov_177_758072_g195_i0_p5_ORF_typecomplete_len316_score21_15Peptidase_C1/PF00112_23/3_3e29Peptidase_C1_2/PF03051_15/0_00062_NODE_221_length_11248_cov_177_758072_g195_i01015611103
MGLEKCQWNQLCDSNPQSTHSKILRVLLGPCCSVIIQRPSEDYSKCAVARNVRLHAPIGDGHIRCSQVSTQYPLNCLTKAGTCEGGSDLILYSELHKEGAPDDTCESYVAEDKKCSKKNRCRNCFGPPGKGKCFPQESYHKYKAKDFGFMKNDDIPNTEPGRLSMHHNKESPNLHRMIQSMKTEIFNRGPISCVVDADPMFNYTAGDIIDRAGDEINHVISIAGWGKEDGTEYWIGRNSWGTYWGDQGWMRIRMGTNSVFVESFCSWVEPDWPPIEVHEDLSSNVDEPHACSGCSSKSHCPERCMHEDDATPIVV